MIRRAVPHTPLKTIRRLCLDPRYIHMSLISGSPTPSKKIRKKSLAASMQGRLSKPLVPCEVGETLIRLIGEHRRSAAENASHGEYSGLRLPDCEFFRVQAVFFYFVVDDSVAGVQQA